MKSNKNTALDLKLKINDISQAIMKLKTWNAMHGRIGEVEKYDLNKERIALLEESKQLFLNRLKELEEKERED